MPRKKITKIDPRKELSPYLHHQNEKANQKEKHHSPNKLSASLHHLRSERKRSLFKRLGSILVFSVLAVIILLYYVSPLTNINSVEVRGADDLPTKEVVKFSGIKASDKVFTYQFHPDKLSSGLAHHYPEVQSASVEVYNFNRLRVRINEYGVIGYIKDGEKYRKILTNGKIGSQSLSWQQVQHAKPLFVGYNHHVSLKKDLRVFNSFPLAFRKKVKVLSGNSSHQGQMVLIMKDGNVVIGDTSNIKTKIKYYNNIKKSAGKNSLIDLEIGAYSRPLTIQEKKAYGIS